MKKRLPIVDENPRSLGIISAYTKMYSEMDVAKDADMRVHGHV